MGRVSELDTIERAAVLGPLSTQVQEASAWYERETGLPAGPGAMSRILAILLYVEQQGCQLGDCELTLSSDAQWAQRRPRWPHLRVRTPEQADAVHIGSSSEGGSKQHVFIHRRSAQ